MTLPERGGEALDPALLLVDTTAASTWHLHAPISLLCVSWSDSLLPLHVDLKDDGDHRQCSCTCLSTMRLADSCFIKPRLTWCASSMSGASCGGDSR